MALIPVKPSQVPLAYNSGSDVDITNDVLVIGSSASGGQVAKLSPTQLRDAIIPTAGQRYWAVDPGPGFGDEYSYTDDVVLTAAQDGAVINNAGAAKAITVTLPAAIAGREYEIGRIAAFSITVKAGAGDSIADGLPAGSYVINSRGVTVFVCRSDGTWEIILGGDNSGVTNAKDYGAAPGKTAAENTSAILTAISTAGASGDVLLPPGTYDVSGKLTTLFRQKLRGSGELVTILNKVGNFDMVELASGSSMEGIGLAGNGGTYTGRGVIITTGTQQVLRNCSVLDMSGYCVEWTADGAGANGGVSGGTYYRTVTTNNAMLCPTDTAAANRYIRDVDTAGGWLVDSGGCDNLRVTNCRMQNMTFGASSAKVQVTGCRMSSTGTDVTVAGTSQILANNIIAANAIIASGANGCEVGPNVYAGSAPNVTNNSGNFLNQIHMPQYAYVPVFVASGGGDKGSSTLYGSVACNGTTATVNILFTVDTGGAWNPGTGDWTFSLPAGFGPTNGASTHYVGIAHIFDTGNNFRTGACKVAGGGTTLAVYVDGENAAIKYNKPASVGTWATGDEVHLSITYPIV